MSLPAEGVSFRSMSPALPRCDQCTLRSVTLCGAFIKAAPKQFESIERTTEKIPARRVISRAGTAPGSLSVVREGWAFSYTILNDGRRHIYYFYVPGDAIGLHVDPNSPLPYAVQALTLTTVCEFNLMDMITQGLEHPEFSRDLRKRYVDYVRVLEDRLIYISRYPAASRIASLILHLRGRLERYGMLHGDEMDFPLTQSHVADALGLTATHVNRMLGDLKARGIVSVAGGKMTIHDLNRLSEIALSTEG
jgi:CRP/FNR family transcriptional regulator, anaerobic regulatory protein